MLYSPQVNCRIMPSSWIWLCFMFSILIFLFLYNFLWISCYLRLIFNIPWAVIINQSNVYITACDCYDITDTGQHNIPQNPQKVNIIDAVVTSVTCLLLVGMELSNFQWITRSSVLISSSLWFSEMLCKWRNLYIYLR